MANENMELQEVFTPGYWTAKRRSWLYGIAVAAIPLLVAIGTLTNDTAQLVLNIIASILAVGSGSMALNNLTPDNVFRVGIEPTASLKSTVRKASASRKK
jgi:hypothetical protein